MENFPRKILKLFMKKEIALEETSIKLGEKEKVVRREWVKIYKKSRILRKFNKPNGNPPINNKILKREGSSRNLIVPVKQPNDTSMENPEVSEEMKNRARKNLKKLSNMIKMGSAFKSKASKPKPSSIMEIAENVTAASSKVKEKKIYG